MNGFAGYTKLGSLTICLYRIPCCALDVIVLAVKANQYVQVGGHFSEPTIGLYQAPFPDNTRGAYHCSQPFRASSGQQFTLPQPPVCPYPGWGLPQVPQLSFWHSGPRPSFVPQPKQRVRRVLSVTHPVTKEPIDLSKPPPCLPLSNRVPGNTMCLVISFYSAPCHVINVVSCACCAPPPWGDLRTQSEHALPSHGTAIVCLLSGLAPHPMSHD